MKMNKWFLMLAMALVASMGLTACGDDEETVCSDDSDCAAGRICLESLCKLTCSTDAECSDGQICGSQGVCEAEGTETCADDRDCDAGFFCDTATSTCVADECVNDNDCPGTDECIDGQCSPVGDECTPETQVAECAPDTAYCADTGECTSFACGSTFNNCNRCGQGPNAGARSAGGPVIFLPNPGTCARNVSATTCQEDAPFLCDFNFLAYGVDGQIPDQAGLRNNVLIITGSGNTAPVFGITRKDEAPNVRIGFKACFATSGTGNTPSGVVIKDNGGRFSNSLCISGS